MGPCAGEVIGSCRRDADPEEGMTLANYMSANHDYCENNGGKKGRHPNRYLFKIKVGACIALTTDPAKEVPEKECVH